MDTGAGGSGTRDGLSAAEAYAEGHFRLADSLTLHPYLGGDSVAPFLKWCPRNGGGRGVFVLVRTSNPGAKDLQDLRIGEEPLCDRVARAVSHWGESLEQEHGYHAVGAVIGATWPDELARLRGLLPNSWLLIPGVGAQGGKVEDLAAAFDGRGLGALAPPPQDEREALGAAALADGAAAAIAELVPYVDVRKDRRSATVMNQQSAARRKGPREAVRRPELKLIVSPCARSAPSTYVLLTT